MSNVSFTVRRPTPASNDSSDVDSPFKVPALPQRLRDQEKAPRSSSPLNPNGKRTLAFDDSDEEHDEVTEELVVGFDRMGAQRASSKEEKKGPLVIPALPNKDWRAAAKEAAAKRRKGYIPGEGKAIIGPDGSVGGLGTRDTINSGPQQSGLIIYKKRKLETDQSSNPDESKMETDDEDTPQPESVPEEPVDVEKQAIDAILYAAKQANGEIPLEDSMPVAAIPMTASRVDAEAEAYRDDVATRPNSATLDDYKRMPVSQFGTALLMGMGWKPGMGASKTGKGPSSAIVPKARPALLGLGAKPQDLVEGSGKKNVKPSKRYVPVVAVERGESSRSDKGSERSRSERDERDRDRDRHDGDRRERDRSRDQSSRRDRDRSQDRRESDRDRDYDRRGDSRRRSDRDDRRERDRDRDYDEKRKDRYRDDKRDDRRDDRGDDSRRRK